MNLCNYMVPTLMLTLSQLKDELISSTDQNTVENLDFFYNENSFDGLPYQFWDWNNYFYYQSLLGLQFTEAFKEEIGEDGNDPIDYKFENYERYLFQSGLLTRYCND